MKKECKCTKCVNCCSNLPGIFNGSKEVIKAAKYLKLNLKTFLEKHCISGYRDDIVLQKKTYDVKFVYPAKIGWEGKQETHNYPFCKDDCTFLKDSLCQIHAVKPLECKKHFGCEELDKDYREICLLQWAKEWENNGIPKEIKDFVGGTND